MFSSRHETVPKKKSYVHALIYKYMNKIKYNFVNSFFRVIVILQRSAAA